MVVVAWGSGRSRLSVAGGSDDGGDGGCADGGSDEGRRRRRAHKRGRQRRRRPLCSAAGKETVRGRLRGAHAGQAGSGLPSLTSGEAILASRMCAPTDKPNTPPTTRIMAQ